MKANNFSTEKVNNLSSFLKIYSLISKTKLFRIYKYNFNKINYYKHVFSSQNHSITAQAEIANLKSIINPLTPEFSLKF